MLKTLKNAFLNVAAVAAMLMLFACSPLFAKCITNDAWHGTDKQIHFAAGAAIAAGVTVHTRDAWKGFYAGAAVGVLKEALDATGPGTCSLQDMLVTIAGAGIGSYTAGRWMISPTSSGGVQVSYAREF